MLKRLWPFRKSRTGQESDRWSLSSPLVTLSNGDSISLGRALCGIFVAGQTGSGKSTSSATQFAMSMLRNGFGGLVLSVKNERKTWERLCKTNGRSDDLIIFNAHGKWRFNPIDFEVCRKGEGAGLIENVLHLLMTLLEVGGRSTGKSDGREESGYWKQACRQLLRNAIDILILATGRVTVPDLYQVIISAPTSLEQVRSEGWRSVSQCFRCLAGADKREKTEREQRDFALVADYFLLEYPALSEKTRSVIVSTFTSLIDCVQRGLLRDLFCGDSNITPEAIEDGKIILVDLPVKEFGQVGLLANLFWKIAFQNSIERRNVEENPRPVFLFCDEGQHFLHADDSLFQSTCRSSRVASVLITQNIPNLDVALGGGDAGRAASESLLANFGTLVFHCNTCQRTNEFAATLIGRTLQVLANGNSSHQQDDWQMAALSLGKSGQTSAGFSEHWEYAVQISEFTRLRTGGPMNHWQADAFVVQSGATFGSSGRTWARLAFPQHI